MSEAICDELRKAIETVQSYRKAENLERVLGRRPTTSELALVSSVLSIVSSTITTQYVMVMKKELDDLLGR